MSTRTTINYFRLCFITVFRFGIHRTVFNFLYLQAQNLRKNVTRVEEDNESLMLQLKKMATKAKSNF